MNSKPTKVSNPIDLPALEIVLGSLVSSGKNASVTRENLYADFLQHLTACTGSLAGAVLVKRANSAINLVGQCGWATLPPPVIAQVKERIKQTLRRPANESSKPSRELISTFVGKTTPIDGVEFLCILVRKRDADPLVENLLEDLVREIATEIEHIELRRAADNQPLVVNELAQLVQLTQNIAKTKSHLQMSMHLVNDLAKITDAQRVTYFTPGGKIQAISGVPSIARSALSRTLSRLARLSSKNQKHIESTPEQVALDEEAGGRPSRINSLSRKLLEQLDSHHVIFTPLEFEGRCSGVIAFEYFGSTQLPRPWIEQRKLILRAVEFIAPIVDRAVSIHSIPGFRWLDWLFNRLLIKPIRLLFWLISWSAIAATLGYFLFYVERPFEIQAEGRLRPKIERHLFATEDGEIRDLQIADAAIVTAGQLLLQIESQALLDQQIAIEGELSEIDKKLRSMMIADLQADLLSESSQVGLDKAAQFAAEQEQLRLRQLTLEKRLDLLSTRQANLKIESPISGQVITPDLEPRLRNRPVNRGDRLLSIADLEGEWEIELDLPDSRVQFLQASPTPAVKFKLITSSEQIYDGQLREVDFKVQPGDASELRQVKAWIEFAEGDLRPQLRHGARVIAKFECGNRTNWFLLTYELQQKLREWWFW